MLTNNERRSVAQMLRNDADGGTLPHMNFLQAISYDIGSDGSVEGTLNRLADLIEPMPKPVCRDASDVVGRFKCSECGCVIYDTSQVDFGMVNYCPDCGRWVEVG